MYEGSPSQLTRTADLFLTYYGSITFIFFALGALARDEELQEKLWTFSENLMNEKVKV